MRVESEYGWDVLCGCLSSCVVTTQGVADLCLVVVLLLVLLLKEESRALDTIDVHQVVTRLGHGQIVGFALYEPLMEVFQLIELLKHVINVTELHTGRLGHLRLQFLIPVNALHLLVVEHGRANLILLFEDFNLGVFAPDHDLQCRFALETVLILNKKKH